MPASPAAPSRSSSVHPVGHPAGGESGAPKEPPRELYRAGAPFSDEELQMMVAEGALEHLIADVYAPAWRRHTPGLRARAARLLLPSAVASSSVLCGESAAWIQLGGSPGPRLTLISPVFRRGRAAGSPLWQVHQVELSDHDVRRVSGVAVTTLLRTAGDLFLGVGTTDSRRSLDLLAAGSVHARHPELSSAAGAADPAWMSRWWLLAELMHARRQDLDAATLSAHLVARVRRRRHDPDRPARIRTLVDQCASRRRPTVR
ncbi:hypothetical protein [Nesterenkonia xinjiangensis]|uniref:Uncharacterized protein n=1 Tax=Nesterenkonia xinjiangensis TaxID=225327 RepID=A0A7Z0GP64_9MICC|nr:hypothetical protein [Nesterenkonia xinjiangensis]NYJ79586.1 hypothetical protein [Nesterenkonia xinjiangensis]